TVAGRTDAGVHATGQVCHLDVPGERWPPLAASIVRRLAGLLPLDVRVYRATPVPDTFDARFSALSRRYEYRVTDAEFGAEPLARHHTAAWPRRLDLDALNAAGAALLGQHDFAAFCRRKEHATTIRVMSRLDWRRDPDGILVATVEADAFCQSMVRSLVGAQLTMRERSSEVIVAPAHGLTLVAVEYPSDVAELERRATVTRRRRDDE